MFVCLQVEASVEYACVDAESCEPSEILGVLQEMDRRYFLIQDFRWEFSLLDGEQKDSISEEQARFVYSLVSQ